MAMVCEKCGSTISEDSLVCMNCGAAAPRTAENAEKIAQQKVVDEKKASESNPYSLKAIGAVLIILGIVADVFSMFLIHSLDFGAFSAVSIFGTISFLIGWLLFANG